MKKYSSAPSEVADRVAHLIKLFNRDLLDAGVKIDLLSVTNDDEEAVPLTLHGYPCQAVVRIINSKDRAKGCGDAEIVIDEANYLTLTDAERDALCDHELHHLEVCKTKKGRLILDENRRPKLKMKKHDVQIGWFETIAIRHGAASAECKQAARVLTGGAQSFFAFFKIEHKDKPAAKRIGGS